MHPARTVLMVNMRMEKDGQLALVALRECMHGTLDRVAVVTVVVDIMRTRHVVGRVKNVQLVNIMVTLGQHQQVGVKIVHLQYVLMLAHQFVRHRQKDNIEGLVGLVQTVPVENIPTKLVRLAVKIVFLANIKIKREKTFVKIVQVDNIRTRQLQLTVKIVQLVKLQKAPVNQVAQIVTGGIIRQQQVKTHVVHAPPKVEVGQVAGVTTKVILATVPIRLVMLVMVEVSHLVVVVVLTMAMVMDVVRHYPIYVTQTIGYYALINV